MPLDDRALRLLDFEREWWTHAGTREAAIRAEFDMAPDAYHRELDQVIFDGDALAHDRMLIKRLRRLSHQRRRQGDSRPSSTPAPRPSGGSACSACGESWPSEQLNLRGRCPNCLWGGA